MEAMDAMKAPHTCAHAQCTNDGTHVVIEGDPRHKLFTTGAGICCDDHTREYSQMGGVPMDLDLYFETASDHA